MSDKKRTYDANAAVANTLRLEPAPSKEKQDTHPSELPRRRQKGFSPALINRIIEQIREL